MFISYKYNKSLSKDAVTDKYFYEYTIVDSDFTIESAPAGAIVFAAGVEGASVVIQEYSKRNLNVAANLVRLAHFISKTYGWSFEYIFNCWKRDVSEYDKDVQKYLVLI